MQLFECGSGQPSPPVTFESPCECRDAHGKARLAAKNDPATPPADASVIQAVTPSDIFSRPGPDVHLTGQSNAPELRINGMRSTGRVLAVKAETDGDLHIELQDASGDKPGIVIVEVPAEPQWCEIRNTVFSWSRTRFPFHTSLAKKPALNQTPVVTVTGKAYFDVGHSLKDQRSNRRKRQPNYAACKIHSVMKLEIQ